MKTRVISFGMVCVLMSSVSAWADRGAPDPAPAGPETCKIIVKAPRGKTQVEFWKDQLAHYYTIRDASPDMKVKAKCNDLMYQMKNLINSKYPNENFGHFELDQQNRFRAVLLKTQKELAKAKKDLKAANEKNAQCEKDKVTLQSANPSTNLQSQVKEVKEIVQPPVQKQKEEVKATDDNVNPYEDNDGDGIPDRLK